MQFTNLLALVAAATMVSAIPTEQGGFPQGGDYGDHSMDSKCSNNMKAVCCNSLQQGGSEGAGGLIGNIPVLNNVLSGSCALTVIGGSCRQGSIACCNTEEQNGVVNVGTICAPISA